MWASSGEVVVAESTLAFMALPVVGDAGSEVCNRLGLLRSHPVFEPARAWHREIAKTAKTGPLKVSAELSRFVWPYVREYAAAALWIAAGEASAPRSPVFYRNCLLPLAALRCVNHKDLDKTIQGDVVDILLEGKQQAAKLVELRQEVFQHRKFSRGGGGGGRAGGVGSLPAGSVSPLPQKPGKGEGIKEHKGGNTGSGNSGGVVCFNCREKGHFARDCLKAFKSKEEREKLARDSRKRDRSSSSSESS
jgi:hypothetical protein